MTTKKPARLTQLDAFNLVKMLEGKPVDASQAARLVKRGLARFQDSQVFATEAGQEALRHWGWR